MNPKFDLAQCQASIQEKTQRIEERLNRLGFNAIASKKPLIFLGPSLPLEKAMGCLDAVFWPPIARDDLGRAMKEGYRVFGIIDGVLQKNLTVSTDEIRFALESGATLYGASSIGALRAAETYPLGMRGVGMVYRWYREKVVDCDDEVAVSFDAATGKILTEPSVNLRATLSRLQSEGKLGPGEVRLLLKKYLELPFSQRNLGNLFHSLASEISPDQAKFWRELLESGWVNQKALDALELLQTIRESSVVFPA